MILLHAINNVILIANLIRTTYSIESENKHFKDDENSHLEVRAVIVKCKISDSVDGAAEGDAARFQREELFKHNALRDCKQKLALTVKASNGPDRVSGDEYIPIDHVLGANKKRIRILHPYVLRLRRKIPFQVYKLHRIDTVRGFIATTSEDNWMIRNGSKRSQRDTQPSGSEDWSAFGPGSVITLDHDYNKHSFSIKVRDKSRKSKSKKLSSAGFNTCANANIWHNANDSLITKRKRVKRMIKKYDENLSNRWPAGDGSTNLNKGEVAYDEYEHFNKNNLHLQQRRVNSNQKSDGKNIDSLRDSDRDTETIEESQKIKKEIFVNTIRDKERMFALYEIGDPDLWYDAQIQLFEKLTTPEGKTMWNDLTKEDIASVSSFNPEWSNQDLNVKYKPIDWLARNEFTLPNNSLCLVVPLKVDSDTPVFDKNGDFIIVPIDDIITVNDIKTFNKRDNKADNFSDASTEESEVEGRRRVVVRVTRALMGGSAGSLKIIARGNEHYLKLPHTKPHHAQIDIEGRADDNELVLVGALGRLTTIVSDTTRKTRSILTVLVTNTGLAAAPFRVFIRECTPELSNEEAERSEKVAGPDLLPPRHTRTFRLSLPIENAVKGAQCVMALLNQDDESIAIRDVRIKRDDRCFCVWHCDCVCLSEDPKLLCRGLTEAQMAAAGLNPLERPRHARSVCYPDVVSINFFVTFIGVLLALLLLGVCKACLGLILRCVGSCGLYLLLQIPRKLDRYYENSLRCRPVVYDHEGWPVHPDSKERSVRLVSTPVEFVLNIIFFITVPCLMIWEAIRKFALHFKAKETREDMYCRKSETKKCFSSHDAQMSRGAPRRRRTLLRWMSPHAEKLSTDIWTEGLTPAGTTTCDCPLLPKKKTCCMKSDDESLCSDSDEDTEYVLMQMQKSSESLAKCQQNKEDKVKTQVNKNISTGNKKR